MKAHLLFTTALVAVINLANAQYYSTPVQTGNPNNINLEDLEYPVNGGLPSGWTVIHAGNQSTPNWTPVQNIPFNFLFNGVAETQYIVSTSGVLTFTTLAGATSAPTSINYLLPKNSIPNNSICVWGISGKGSNDKIVTKTFGTAPNRQHWITFNDYSMPAIFNSHYTYWSIVLEESTNSIYIVDQRTSTNLTQALTLGIQINNTTAFNVAGSPQISSASSNSPTRTDNTVYTFHPGNLPNRDITTTAILLDDIIAAPKGPFDIKVILENRGSDTIQSLDLNYTSATGIVTGNLTNLNLLPWQIDTVVHPQSWSPNASTTVLKAWATNLNGNTDQNNLNDTAKKSIIVLQQSAPRVPLLESFTSSTSAQSKNLNDQLKNVLDQQSLPYVHIKYPMNWPGTGDPYYTNEGGARRQFYGVSTVPNLQVNGEDWAKYNYMLAANTLNTAREKIALLNMTSKFYVNGQEVCTEIELNPLVDISNPNLKLYVAIYEKKSLANTKSSGDLEFYHVMKKMMPNGNGTSISSLVSGQAHIENLCFTFKGTYILPPNGTQPVNLSTRHTIEDFNDLGVSAWLQDEVTKEVYQASEAAFTIGLNEMPLEGFHAQVYPNPAKDQATLLLQTHLSTEATIQIINITGQITSTQTAQTKAGNNLISLNTSQLAKGVYMVHVAIPQQVITKKLIIE